MAVEISLGLKRWPTGKKFGLQTEGLSSQFQIAYKRCVIALTQLILALKVEARNT